MHVDQFIDVKTSLCATLVWANIEKKIIIHSYRTFFVGTIRMIHVVVSWFYWDLHQVHNLKENSYLTKDRSMNLFQHYFL